MMVRILGKKNAEVPLSGGLFALEESQTYAVVGVPRHANVSLGSVRLEWNPGSASFALPIGFWVGNQELRIQDGESALSFPVRVDPSKDKLPASEWMVMLQELESWMPGGTVGREGGTLGKTSEGVPAPMVAVALGPLIPVLVKSLLAIGEQPKSRRIEFEHDVSLHAVRKVGTDTLRWLAHKPEVMTAIDPWAVVRQGPRNPLVPQFLAEDSVDHPVNRYIAWAVARITAKLRATAKSLERAASEAGTFSDSKSWYSARAAELTSGAEALAYFLRNSFLRQVPPELPSESAILALHDEPRYARVHALLRRFLAPRFNLSSGEGPAAAVRPSYGLYEVWCFLAMQRALAACLPGADWKDQNLDCLLDGTGEGARYVATAPGKGSLELHFNRTFRGFSAGQNDEWFSISTTRRPDFVIAWYPTRGTPGWLILDAKYRVSRKSVQEAFESAHIYRDSLVWPTLGGRCQAMWLLVPAVLKKFRPWTELEFMRRFGMGLRCLTPGSKNDESLGSEVLAALKVL